MYVYFLVSQISVDQMIYHPTKGHYLTVQEADGNIQVCIQLQTSGIFRDPLHIREETIHSKYKPAIGKSNNY